MPGSYPIAPKSGLRIKKLGLTAKLFSNVVVPMNSPEISLVVFEVFYSLLSNSIPINLHSPRSHTVHIDYCQTEHMIPNVYYVATCLDYLSFKFLISSKSQSKVGCSWE